MDRRRQLLVSIGVFGGFLGFLAYAFAPADGLLPLNRMLLGLVCGLIVIWTLVFVIQAWGDKP
ncbi:hypothetical protein MKK64_02005 [Methylobacterium sp. E-025]|uniref:hypothetical protein n=1 Tax=Methylobacterium sp. E-025 TaxID=2836561 RepID=UPI001FBBB2CB|nr:hypothetical protein [Methylobacterium sp. E-025]MCJ2109997.1 hypothetical protein [Methylobacterium sp. E-025]